MPNNTDNEIRDYGFRSFCSSIAEYNIELAENYYTKWDISLLFEWYAINISTSYRPPKK